MRSRISDYMYALVEPAGDCNRASHAAAGLAGAIRHAPGCLHTRICMHAGPFWSCPVHVLAAGFGTISSPVTISNNCESACPFPLPASCQPTLRGAPRPCVCYIYGICICIRMGVWTAAGPAPHPCRGGSGLSSTTCGLVRRARAELAQHAHVCTRRCAYMRTHADL